MKKGISRKCAMLASLGIGHLTGKSLPLMVNWAVTGRCNLKCRHCYGRYGERKTPDLDYNSITAIIDQLAVLGTRRITIEGGEPLLRSDLAQIIRHIESKNMEVCLCTNGILLPKILPEINGMVDLFVLSLDGNEEHHDFLRGAGNYKKVLDALAGLQSVFRKPLIFSCLTPQSINDIDHLVRIAENFSAYIAFNFTVAALDGKVRTALPRAGDAAYRQAVQKIINLKKLGKPVYYSFTNYKQALLWHDYSTEQIFRDDLKKIPVRAMKNYIHCRAGRFYAYIEADGKMYPCYQTVGTIPGIPALPDVKKAWFSLVAQEHCRHCYNLTLSELNLQMGFSPSALSEVLLNYFFRSNKFPFLKK